MANCSCATGILNSGVPTCSDAFGRTVKLIFVNYYNSAGEVNKVTYGTSLSNGTIAGFTQNVDKTARWYPTAKITNVSDVREDDVVENIEGVDYTIEDGVRNFSGEFVEGMAGTPAYVSFLKSLKCGEIGVFYVTDDNKIVGQKVGQDLHPFLIQNGSVKVKTIPATYSNIQKTMISFALDKSMSDETFGYREGEFGGNLLKAKGLISISFSELLASTVSTNEISFNASVDAGNNARKVAFPESNFTYFNNTTALNIVPESVATDGVLHKVTFSVADVTIGDIVTVNFPALTSGYEVIRVGGTANAVILQ